MTSTSAYFAACAAATQPLMRTVFFLPSTVAMVRLWSDRFRREIGQLTQLLGLPPVQALSDCECRFHPHDPCIEVQLRHPLEAAGRALFDADAAPLTVVDQYLVETIRSHRSGNTRLGTHEI